MFLDIGQAILETLLVWAFNDERDISILEIPRYIMVV